MFAGITKKGTFMLIMIMLVAMEVILVATVFVGSFVMHAIRVLANTSQDLFALIIQ